MEIELVLAVRCDECDWGGTVSDSDKPFSSQHRCPCCGSSVIPVFAQPVVDYGIELAPIGERYGSHFAYAGTFI